MITIMHGKSEHGMVWFLKGFDNVDYYKQFNKFKLQVKPTQTFKIKIFVYGQTFSL